MTATGIDRSNWLDAGDVREWFLEVIQGAVADSSREHRQHEERFQADPDGGWWYTDEHGQTFEVEVRVAKFGGTQ